MKISSINRIIVLSCLIFCLASSKQGKEKNAYKMGLVWPVYTDYSGSFNYTQQDFPKFNGDNFALNYLYPLSDDTYRCSPQLCPFLPLNIGKIESSDYKYLEKYFYRFGQNNSKTTRDLWKNYASCYNSTQTSYFHTAVNAHKKYNFIEALAAKNIVPDNKKIYDRFVIEDALAVLLKGQKPTLYCAGGKFDEDSKMYVQHLRHFEIFLDKNLEPTDSNEFCTYEYCGQNIIFPTLNF